MGISVEKFCTGFKNNSKTVDNKSLKEYIKKHITTDYVDFLMKDTVCNAIVEATSYIKDGDRKIVKINSNNRDLFFTMKIISLYTDIDISFDNDDVVKQYDKLNKIGAIDALLEAIPKNEYAEFSMMLSTKINDFRENEYSITALLYNLKQELSMSSEVIQSAIAELVKNQETE